jgi:hypothetical protein
MSPQPRDWQRQRGTHEGESIGHAYAWHGHRACGHARVHTHSHTDIHHATQLLNVSAHASSYTLAHHDTRRLNICARTHTLAHRRTSRHATAHVDTHTHTHTHTHTTPRHTTTHITTHSTTHSLLTFAPTHFPLRPCVETTAATLAHTAVFQTLTARSQSILRASREVQLLSTTMLVKMTTRTRRRGSVEVCALAQGRWLQAQAVVPMRVDGEMDPTKTMTVTTVRMKKQRSASGSSSQSSQKPTKTQRQPQRLLRCD